MPLERKMALGTLSIREEVIATLAGAAAMDSYGLASMVSRKQIKDSISVWLGQENIGRGVEVRAQGERLALDVHIEVAYGTRISEVARNVIDKVNYQLEQQIGCVPEPVTVFVQSVRLPQER